ncbi:MAG: glycosyltransferase family 4 protein [Nitrospirae bacterium]|nr:glycosyltransferase family 4 protein [Nitrospirota bacterium]
MNTMLWKGDIPAGFNITVFKPKGMTNHQRCWNFSEIVNKHLSKTNFDLIIGFNKMHGLDIYYAADPCFKARVYESGSKIKKLLPRYRTYIALEKEVFDKKSNTKIMLISEIEKPKYIRYYGTQSSRFHILPPYISKDRIIRDENHNIRKKICNKLEIDFNHFLLLTVGSSFKTKGLDRSLRAIAALPENLKNKTILLIIGDDNSSPFIKLAKKLNIDSRIIFLGGREDVPEFMAASDLLLHPAYTENTGTVLIEAMAAGLPVIATEICGYSFHIRKADAGLLIPSPFKQHDFNNMLSYMMTSDYKQKWKENGLRYISRNDFFSMPEKAADIIEKYAEQKRNIGT